MMMMHGGCCCPLFTNSWLLVPPFYNELSADELQELYLRSMHLNSGRLIVQGLFARADATNTNGRVYPGCILRREVARFRRRHLATGTALGELNHPSYHSAYFRSLNLPNISHQVLELRWRGAELWGTIEVLPTPAGLLLSELYSKGIKLGVSSRGWASVAPDPTGPGRVLVEADYQLITFDFVPEPSNEGAYVVPIARRYPSRRLPDQSAAVAASYLGIGSSSMEALGQLPPASTLRRWLKHTSRAMEAASQAPGQVAIMATAAPGAAAAAAGALQQPPPCALAAEALPGDATAAPLCTRVASGGSCSTSSSSMLAALSACPSLQALPADTPLGGGVVLGCHYHVLHDKPWLPTDPAARQFKVHLSLVATKARLHQAPRVLSSRQQQHVGHHHHQHHLQQQRQQHEQPLLGSPPSDTSTTGSSSLGSLQQQQQQEALGGQASPQQLSSDTLQCNRANEQQTPSDTRAAVHVRAGIADDDADASGSGGSLGRPPPAALAAPHMLPGSSLQQVALAAA